MKNTTISGALEGIIVVDLTRMLSGPYATMMLADHGATVVKVEGLEGDFTRRVGPYLEGDAQKRLGGYFQSLNRNKQSICLDLNSPESRDIIVKLCRKAHVVVSNFRPGVMESLGIGYDTLCKENPKLVYAIINGFGDDREKPSRYKNWPAYDVVAQAMGGLVGITGPNPETPTKTGPGIGDIFPGVLLPFGILAALWAAERSGLGQVVEVSMYDAIVSLCERAIEQFSFGNQIAKPEGQAHPFICPFGMFPAKDGWVAIGCPGDKFFIILAKSLDKPEWLDDLRYKTDATRVANRDALNEALNERTRELTKLELEQRLGGKIPFGPVQSSDEIVRDPHLLAREMVVDVEIDGTDQKGKIVGTPVKLYGTPGGVRHRAPLLGEDLDRILSSVGYTQDQIEQLVASGIATRTTSIAA